MPKTKPLPKQSVPLLTPEELRQVRTCLDLLQQAQHIAELAAQQLCPVRGFCNEWSRLSKPCDSIKRAWHDIEARRQWLASIEHRHLAPAVSLPDDPPPRRRRGLAADLPLGGEPADVDQAAPPDNSDDYECPECGVLLPIGAKCCTACPWSL